MNASLESMLSRIGDGTLLPESYFSNLNCDAALDARDGDDVFDSAWVRAHDEVERRWVSAIIASDLREIAEAIRRESFLSVSTATQHHEIASYVSDDFDLIVRARILGLDDPFIDRLWFAYNRGEFPLPTENAPRRAGSSPAGGGGGVG